MVERGEESAYSSGAGVERARVKSCGLLISGFANDVAISCSSVGSSELEVEINCNATSLL